MRKKLLAGLVIASLSSAADAGPYLLTFTGIVIQSTDNGAFGSPIGGLTGQSYKAEFQFDSLGAALLSTDTSTAKFYYGSGAQSPLSSAKLTINSVTYDFTPYFSQLSEENEFGGNRDQIYGYATNNANSDRSFYSRISSLQNEITSSVDLTQPLNYTRQANDSGDGSFSIKVGSAVTSGSFRADHVTLAPVGVPEPATWAMMIAGFGLIGGAMRLGRSKLSPVTVAVERVKGIEPSS